MKKVLFTAAAFAVLVACNNSDSGDKGKETGSEPAKPASVSDNPDYKKGLALIGQSDCLTCHKVDEAINGPSYRQVAEKYADQAPGIIPQLAEKVIKGGSGVWGSVPMLAHPNLSQEDAEAMVKYILLLKK